MVYLKLQELTANTAQYVQSLMPAQSYAAPTRTTQQEAVHEVESLTVKQLHGHLTKTRQLCLCRSKICSSAADQTLVIPKMPLTPLLLHAPHQTILCCLLPGLPNLHARHRFCVQGVPPVGDATASCQYLSTVCPSQHDQ